jgi:ATP-dependent protease ClpP protease subunit
MTQVTPTPQATPSPAQPAPDWYSIRQRTATAQAAASAGSDTPKSSAEIYIYGDIGESWYGDTVTAAQFVKDINALTVDAITIRINSYGGSVPDGTAIYNAIKRHKAHVTVTIDGVAMSVASVIAMAGDTVEMADNAILMIHAPWMYSAGNSTVLREQADMLDQFAAALATSYAAKTGQSVDAMLALMLDGKDHYYTAAEALAGGFVDTITAALPVAASATVEAKRFQRPLGASPVAAATPTPAAPAVTHPEISMTGQVTPTPAAPDATAILAADKQRRNDISAKFAPFAQREGVAAMQKLCEDDTACTPQAAADRLLAHMGAQCSPVAGHIRTVEDEADKTRDAITQALLARAGVSARAENGQVQRIQADSRNPYRGRTLLALAESALVRAGIRTEGMDKMQIVASAFTQGTSDFTVLLENTMHKALQAAYATAPDTWSRFCATGSVSDFRAHNRYRVGSLGNLLSKTELGEFKNKSIPDGEKSAVTVGTKGYIINLSREAIINDDLGAFVGLSTSLGRAASRTVEADVYTLLASNPTLADGVALFHATHGNLAGSGAVISVSTVDAARMAMASQMDVGGNDYLDIRPSVWVGPLSLGSVARTINGAEYDDDAQKNQRKPNVVRGLYGDIVDTPRLTGTAWYSFASASEAPVLEVDFLDGNQTPYLEMEQGFTVDGARYKVRLDFGVTAIDCRGAYKNAGA